GRGSDVAGGLADMADHRQELDAVAVVDEEGRLLGDLTLFDLVVAPPDAPLGELLREERPVTVRPDAPVDVVASQLTEARRSSLLVVDEEGRPGGRFLAHLALAGPGRIAANAGNDAGGIATYASAGAQFRYRTLFFMVLVTVALVVVQEMSARLGAYTGKGLAALIREEFSVRVAGFALLCLVVANTGLVVSEFAGIGAAMELFHVSRYISIPAFAAAIWAVVVFSSYSYAERVFLLLSLVFLTYPLAALLGHPHWATVANNTVIPHFTADRDFIFLGVALIGTTITPYMQLYGAAGVVDRGIGPDEYRYERIDAVSGVIFANVISMFIIIATA